MNADAARDFTIRHGLADCIAAVVADAPPLPPQVLTIIRSGRRAAHDENGQGE